MTNLPLVENGLSGRGSRGALEADEDTGEGEAPPHHAANTGLQWLELISTSLLYPIALTSRGVTLLDILQMSIE